MRSSVKKAGEIRKRYEKIWMGLDNVNGVGTGQTIEGRACIVISLAKDDPVLRDIFPAEIEDIPLEIRIIGELDAL